MMETPALPTCPKCKQSDQIQKVTSTYGANTLDWYETKSRTDTNGHTSHYQELHEAHTQLGLRLKPPQQPVQPTHPGLWYGIGGLIALVFLSVLCSIAFIPLSFIPALLGVSSFLPVISGIPSWVVAIAVVVLPIVCIVLLGLGLALWLGLKVKRRFGYDMRNYRDKKGLYDQYELPRWQHARDRWEELYYCMRDEVVFIPGENRAIKIDNIEKYLYDPLFRD